MNIATIEYELNDDITATLAMETVEVSLSTTDSHPSAYEDEVVDIYLVSITVDGVTKTAAEIIKEYTIEWFEKCEKAFIKEAGGVRAFD